MRWTALILLGLVLQEVHSGEVLQRKSCGYDPLRHTNVVAGRGVNETGGAPAKWLNQDGVFPNPPDQKTVVTYSIITATENYSNQTLDPINDANFIGATTLATVREGIESWNDTAGITLQFVSTGGQIRVGSAVLAGSTVGLGGYRVVSRNGSPFYMFEGFVQLDRSDGAWDAPTLRAVAAHEMGHALGLNHTSDNTALMAPQVNNSVGARADDRFYMQFLYGSAPAKLSAETSQNAPVSLTIGRAAPKQTGTDSTSTFDGSFNSGNGTGTKTQNDVLKYVVERKGPGEANFTVLDSNVLAPTTQNADPEISHALNAFAFSDATATTTGLYSYRVKAVHQTGGGPVDDVYSATVTVNVGNGGGTGGGGGGGDSNPETLDTDADGFPDSVEVAAGTSASDASQTPFGGVPATNSQQLTVTKSQIALNFKTPGRDTFALAGTIPATDAFTVENQTAIVDFGGLIRVFLLSSKGIAVDRDAKAKVGPKVSKGVVKYSFSGSKGSYQDSFDDELLTSRDTATTGETVTVNATVYLQSTKYIAPQSLIYKAKTGKTGKAKRAN